MKRSMLLPFSVLASVPFVMVLGNSMLIPVFPRMEEVMNLSQFQVGLIVTAFSIPAGILIPFTGALSDHLGRKTIMTPALILYGLGGLVAGFAALFLAKPFAVIIAGRILQGIGAGGTYQIALALTGDVFTSDERTKAVGLLEAANGLGKVASPILGSLFALIAWFVPFFVYGILAIPVALAVWWIVKEPKKKREKQSTKEYLRSIGRIFKVKGASLGACYLAGMIGLFLLFGLLSFLSDELEARYDIRDFAKGFVLAIPVGTMALTSYLAGTLLQDREKLHKPVVVAGLAVTCAAYAVLSFVGSLIPALILVSLIGLGIGSILPPINTMITGATRAEERGVVTSLYGSVRFFGVAIGPPLFGLVMDVGRLPMFLGAAAVAALAAAVAWFAIRPGRLEAKQGQEAKQDEAQGESPSEGPESSREPSPSKEPGGSPELGDNIRPPRRPLRP